MGSRGDADGTRGRLPAAALRLTALAAAVSACATAPAAATPAGPGVIFRDDFSDANSGWDQHTGADAITNYDDGQYLIAVEEPLVDVWARPGLELTDVVVEAEARYAGGPVNNEFGLMCRYSRGGDGRNSFYFFFASTDGYYALGKVEGDVRQVLSPADGSFQPTDAIRQAPDAVNHLTAVCDGTHFSLTVNGTVVGEFEDDSLPRGDIGLIAGTFDEGGVRLHFDNVVARRPDQGE